MSFWDIVWFIFISFAFFAYLMVLFQILSDLFRDSETSGFLKAVWIVALIFLPLLTSLIYLVARGKGMAERSMRDTERVKQQQDAYIRNVAGKASPVDQIAQAQAMLDAGSISQAEYDQLSPPSACEDPRLLRVELLLGEHSLSLQLAEGLELLQHVGRGCRRGGGLRRCTLLLVGLLVGLIAGGGQLGVAVGVLGGLTALHAAADRCCRPRHHSGSRDSSK
jgi:hypothetical protein